MVVPEPLATVNELTPDVQTTFYIWLYRGTGESNPGHQAL